MVESLGIVRGVSAYAVVLSHCVRVLEANGTTGLPFWLRWLDMGYFAVVVFFCLSGFTLVLAHGADRWDGAGLTRFFVRRVFRVYPAFLVSFALCLLVVVPLYGSGIAHPGNWVGDTNRVPGPEVIAAYLTFTSNWFGMDGYVNTVFWSLPVEFQFYLMFPVYALLLRRSIWLALGASIALAIAARLLHLPGQTFTLSWIFAGGMAMAWIFQHRAWSMPGWLAASVVAVASVLACAMSNVPRDSLRLFPGPLDAYFGLFAFAIVMGAAYLAVPRTPGRVAAFWIGQGEISYSVYLFHIIPVLLIYAVLQRFRLQGGEAIAAVYLGVLPGAWAIAHAMSRAIERPGVALGRRLSDRRRPERITS